MKTSEKRFSNVFREFRKGKLTGNGLTVFNVPTNWNLLHISIPVLICTYFMVGFSIMALMKFVFMNSLKKCSFSEGSFFSGELLTELNLYIRLRRFGVQTPLNSFMAEAVII